MSVKYLRPRPLLTMILINYNLKCCFFNLKHILQISIEARIISYFLHYLYLVTFCQPFIKQFERFVKK